MKLTHNPFAAALGPLVKTEVPLAPPEPVPEGEPICRLCKRLWSEKPGLAYCVAQHGTCGLCNSPRIRCKCLAPNHWTGGTGVPRAPKPETSQAQLELPADASIACKATESPVITTSDTAYPSPKDEAMETMPTEETQHEEQPEPQSKRRFILQHPELPAAEAVKAAEKAGYQGTTLQQVYNVRSLAKTESEKRERVRLNQQAHRARAAERSQPHKNGAKISVETAFVRSIPLEVKPVQIVKLGRKAGLRLNIKQVSNVRTRDLREKIYQYPTEVPSLDAILAWREKRLGSSAPLINSTSGEPAAQTAALWGNDTRPVAPETMFVRSFPVGTRPLVIVKAARKAKLKVDDVKVRNVRSRDRLIGNLKFYPTEMPAEAEPIAGSFASPSRPSRPKVVPASALAAPAAPRPPRPTRPEPPAVPQAGALTDEEIELMERMQALGVRRCVVLMQHLQVINQDALRRLRGE